MLLAIQGVDPGIGANTAWGALNTLILVMGPIFIIAAQAIAARSVKNKVDTANDTLDQKLGVIHVAVNSTLTESKNENLALRAQLQSHGIMPLMPAPSVPTANPSLPPISDKPTPPVKP